MSVRDVRLNWPVAEKALGRVLEVVVTRNSKPVARILPYEAPPATRRKRFDAAAHLRWLEEFWRERDPGPSSDELLRRDREA